ncbi:MAG: hypothetical protein WDM78_14835 [Puia sp.]
MSSGLPSISPDHLAKINAEGRLCGFNLFPDIRYHFIGGFDGGSFFSCIR